jgi:acyl dehydratase
MTQLEVGQTLSSFERDTGPGQWNRFAAVNEEFVDIHMDDDAGRAAGFPGAIGMGNLEVAYLHNLLRRVIGTQGRIVGLTCRFQAPNLKGQTVRAGARVAAVRHDGDEVVVELETWVDEVAGSVLCSGTATVALMGAPGGRTA